MATPRQGRAGREEETYDENAVPFARTIRTPADGGWRGEDDDGVPMVVGELVPTPTVAAYAVAATSTTTSRPGDSLPAAPTQPPSTSSSASSYTAPVMHNSTGSFTIAGTSSGVSSSGGWGSSDSKAWIAGAGIQNFPGCGTSSSFGGTHFGKDAAPTGAGGARVSRMSPCASGGGSLIIQDEDYVADGGPVLVACGLGTSMYDVKGCLSSWVFVAGEGGQQQDAASKRIAAAGGGGGFGKAGVGSGAPGRSSWALRSDVIAAGDGGVMCSACVPSIASGKGRGSRTLITGGKDSVLREWEVAEGRPRMVAQMSGHTDWISCCALIPSTTAGAPPTVALSGGRDGSVRFWTKSAAAAVTAGDGGWSMASSMSAAHGSSEFVTCCASPGGSSGPIGGWVATGGTDWSVRLWDVVKSCELGRLSFMGHSHAVRSLASSSDGNLLVSGGDDNKVIIWSPQSRRLVATLKGHESAVHGLAVDPGTHSGHPPRWIASGGGEGFLLVWDPRNWSSPVATLRGEVGGAAPSSFLEAFSSPASVQQEGTLRGGSGARLRGESGRWEGETTGPTMLNSVNCLAAGGAGSGGGDWLFAAGETVVRSWRRRDGIWHGGAELPGEGLGGIASLSMVE